MSMRLTVEGTDDYGIAAYEELFRRILSDMGKSRAIEHARLVLRPEEPLFIYSVRLRAKPEKLMMRDVSEFRQEGNDVLLVISDERHAPTILSRLWSRYGRDSVDQRTRFEMLVKNASAKDMESIEVVSGDKVKNEMIDALWRTLPEGMKTRYHFSGPQTVTILATEGILQPDHKDEARKVHDEMEAVSDV